MNTTTDRRDMYRDIHRSLKAAIVREAKRRALEAKIQKMAEGGSE